MRVNTYNLIKMKTVTKNDNAVSPVIGTILLVAIVVILAAIIAAVVMPMVNGSTTSSTIGVQVTGSNEGKITAVFTGGDTARIIKVVAFGPVGDGVNGIELDGIDQPSSIVVGKAYKVTGDTAIGEPGKTSVIKLVAYFPDGTQQILFQGDVVFPIPQS